MGRSEGRGIELAKRQLILALIVVGGSECVVTVPLVWPLLDDAGEGLLCLRPAVEAVIELGLPGEGSGIGGIDGEGFLDLVQRSGEISLLFLNAGQSQVCVDGGGIVEQGGSGISR